MLTPRRGGEGVSWRKLLAGTVFGVVVVVSIYMFIIPLLLAPPGDLPVYNGRYSRVLADMAASYVDPENPAIRSTAKWIVSEYWLRHYNPVVYNKTVYIYNGTSISIPLYVAGGARIVVNVSSNGSVYYTLALDMAGRERLFSQLVEGNTTIEIPEGMMYTKVYFLASTDNSTVRAHVLIRKYYDSIIDIQRAHGYTWVIWMFDTWIHSEYRIERTRGLDALSSARKPWTILSSNTTNITDIEAVFLLANFYKLYGLDTRLLVLDADGDGEGDHVSLIVKYPGGTGNDFVKSLDKLYVDLGISGDPDIPMNITAKQLVYYGETWLIIDPSLEPHRYVPSMMSLEMKPLGTVKIP